MTLWQPLQNAYRFLDQAKAILANPEQDPGQHVRERYLALLDHSFQGPDVVRFLQLLLRKLQGLLLVIWDGASIHRSQAVKVFLAAGGAKRIHMERLPGYAPELNPQQGVWNVLKRRELKNLCAADFDQLETEVVRAKERLRHRKTVLRQCVAHAGFPL